MEKHKINPKNRSGRRERGGREEITASNYEH